MGSGFLELLPVSEVLRRLERFAPVAQRESIALEEACERVLAQAIDTDEQVPAFARSEMDGFAVRSAEVASARECAPIVLTVIGEVRMGGSPEQPVGVGQAVAIPTGAMLPQGADAVVMVEYTRALPGGRIEVTRAAAPGEHVLAAGADLAAGSRLLPAGWRLNPLDTGALAACGKLWLSVFARPRVAILSTGDELVPADQHPGAGQVRDTNALTLAAQVRAAGGAPLLLGRVADDAAALLRSTREALAAADLLLLSGGSSVGARDHTAAVLQQLSAAKLLVQGIAIAPGKPTLVADCGGRPVFGMPGHPVSSFVVFHVVVAPLLRRLGGQTSPHLPPRVRGVLAANAPASPGRQTWLRVRLEPGAGLPQVIPVAGTSAVYTGLLRCDGLLQIPADREGFARGEQVEVEVLR